MTISGTLPPSGNAKKPLSYGNPSTALDGTAYVRIHPTDLATIEAMIRREVRAALDIIEIVEDDPTPVIATVHPSERSLYDAFSKAVERGNE